MGGAQQWEPRSIYRVSGGADFTGSRLPAGFGHDPDLLREGDEARVVLVGEQERIRKQLIHTRVVCRPGVLQPLEHLLRLFAQGIDAGDLASVVGVFIDQFSQGRVRLRPSAVR